MDIEEDMDLAIELASLDFGVDWDEVNILDGLATPSPPHSPHIELLDIDNTNVPPNPEQLQSSAVETVQTQTNEETGTEPGEAAPTPADTTPVQVQVQIQGSAGSVAVGNNHARGTTVSSGCENPTVPPPVLDDPNPLPKSSESSAPLLNETLSNHPSPSMMGLISEEAVSSTQEQNVTPVNGINQFDQFRNENLLIPSNEIFVPNVIPKNTSSGINNQQPSHPALLQTNPAEAEAEADAGIGTRIPNGQFMTNQRSALSPHHNQIISSHNAWDSRSSQPFTSLLHQLSHPNGMQKIYDVQSDSVHPTHPRLEPHSHLQSGFAPMPPNAYDHPHGHRAMLPEPAVPSGPAMNPNYHPQHGTFSMTNNSLGSGSSVPPRYPQLYDHQNNHYQNSHAIMRNGHGQQGVGSVQLSGPQRVSRHRYDRNRWLNTPSLRSQSSTLHGPTAMSRLTSSQSLSSRILESSRSRMTERRSSQLLCGRASEFSGFPRTQNASGIQLHHVAPVSANNVPRLTAQRDKGTTFETSRAQPSEAILRILNQNAKPTVTPSVVSPTPKQNQSLKLSNPRETWIKDQSRIQDLGKELGKEEPDTAPEKFRVNDGQQEPPHGGCPTKRSEVGESSSPSKRPKKDSPRTENSETPLKSEEACKTLTNEEKEDQNDNNTDPSSAAISSRRIPNAVYDPSFASMGLPLDPHFRSFKPPPEDAELAEREVPYLLQ